MFSEKLGRSIKLVNLKEKEEKVDKVFNFFFEKPLPPPPPPPPWKNATDFSDALEIFCQKLQL